VFSKKIVFSLAGCFLVSSVYFIVSNLQPAPDPNASSVAVLEPEPSQANSSASTSAPKQIKKASSLPPKESLKNALLFSSTKTSSQKTYQAFNDWMDEFQTHQNDINYITTHLEEGIKTAKARYVVLAEDMKKNPRDALSYSLSFYAYSILPQEMKVWVEKPITVHADLHVLPNESANVNVEDKGNRASIVYEEAGKQVAYQVELYGNRKEILSKNNLAIQGIKLGNLAVVNDQSFQLIHGNDITWAEQNLSVVNKNKRLDYYTNENITGEPIRAISEGKLYYFSNKNNLKNLNIAITQLENKLGPNTHIVQRSTTSSKNSSIPDVSLQERLAQKVLLASTWTETNKKVFFIRIDFSDASGESVSKAALETALNGPVSAQLVDFSYGKTNIEGAVNSSQVLASSQVVRMPQQGSVYKNLDDTSFASGSSQLHADAKAAFTALGTGIDLNDFDIVGIHFPNINMGYAGLASLGGSDHWLQNTISTKVIVHELGHNYGLSHANYWDTGGTSVVGAGSEIAYGDPYDTMGGGNGDFHIQGKTRLNWIPSSEWVDVSTSDTYRVYRFDQGVLNTNNKALRVTKGSNEYYWLGYRRDFTTNNVLQKGAYIVWQKPSVINSMLIDTTPGSTGGKEDAGISLGRTYSDSTADIHITPIQQGGSGTDEWLDVRVNIGDFSSNQNPIVTLTAPNTLTARTGLTFSANASDPDGDTLSYDWDFGDGVIHDNTSSLVHSWAVGGTYTIKVTVSDMKGGIATQQINVTVIDPVTQWSNMTSNQTDDIVDIAASSTMAVAITNFAVIGYANGDAAWSELDKRRTAGTGLGYNVYLRSIIYDGSQWIAVGQDYNGSWKGAVYTSSDTNTWTERYLNGNPLQGIATSGSVLVAVGDNGEAIRSTDSGISWTPVSTGITTRLINISYGNSQFIAVGNFYTGSVVIATSPNGLTWTNQTSNSGAASSTGYGSIEYLNDKFVGAGVNSKLGYLENSNGTIFETSRSDQEATPALIFGNGVYFAAGINQSDYVGDGSGLNGYRDIDLVSTDGKSWTVSPSSTSVPNRNSGVFFNNTFITVGDDGSIRQSGIVTTSSTDSDSDGYDDAVEVNVPNATGNTTGDGNGDGIQDNSQSYVTSLRNYSDANWLTYSNTASGDQSNFSTAATPLSVPADDQLILGAIQYDIATTSGASVTIEVYVEKNTAITDYLLLGNDGQWIAQNATVTHVGNKTKLVFTVIEGGNFDRDTNTDGILQLAQGGVMVKTGLEVWPYAYRYGSVEINSPTADKTFTVKNTGSRVLAISGVTLVGNTPNEFVIGQDNCTGQSLAANTSCTIQAHHQPSSLGTKSAMLQISTDDPDNATISIYLNNDETIEQEAERRLPPVLNSLEIPENMTAGQTYTLNWSVLGYHDDYSTWAVFFDCHGITENCGSSFSSNFEFSSKLSPTLIEPGEWSYNGIQSKVFHYSYNFTPSTSRFNTQKKIVIRFYRKNGKDDFVGNSSLSLIIPGDHSDHYYDTTGRRIEKTVNP
jgi:hypothetical protein